MWSKIVAWHDAHYVQISWFLMGSFVAFGINDLNQHDYFYATVDFGLAIANYIFQDR